MAIIPEIAVRDLAAGTAHRISDELLRQLSREAMLAWNPRLLRVRPNAGKIAARLQLSLSL